MAIDQARAVRPEEALDEAALSSYLSNQIDDFAGPITVQQFPSGYSNLTYLLSTPRREYVLRRPPLGNYAPRAHDMQREFQVLSRLKPVYDAVPQPLHYCGESGIIGAPFYVMERVRGVILRRGAPDGIRAYSGPDASGVRSGGGSPDRLTRPGHGSNRAGGPRKT